MSNSGEPSPSTTLHTLHVSPAAAFNRAHALIYAAAILSLFYHHFTTLTTTPHSLTTLIFLLSDVVLAFMWATSQAFLWRPVRRHEYPERLLDLVEQPRLDVFICTADPYKERPIGVASTAISAMAFDYPADRLSVYVSDDGGSELTLYALIEAARFARHWLPFCRANGVDRRSPEAYFGSPDDGGGRNGGMKMMYKDMKDRVETVMEKGYVSDDLLHYEEVRVLSKKWKGYTRQEHPSIIQVVLENGKDTDIADDPVPNLIYVSREKSRAAPHHFKAGALNTLLRVSGKMTGAPVILTLDCDMHSNDPRSPYRALCYLLDPAISFQVAFVQFPQVFQGLNKHDIYGGELKRLFRINSRGKDGIRGPNYVGTCCFHSRRSFYGAPSSPAPPPFQPPNGPISSESILKEALEVSNCNYELQTKWGSKIGFRYGSLVEDYYTGYMLHCQGWRSVFCDPQRPAFLGDAPKNLNDSLSQCKRWAIGLFEVAFSRFSPLTFGTRKVSLLMGLSYAHYSFWGTWCIPIATYAIVPQLALIFGVPLFPKLLDPWFYLYAYLFCAAYVQDLMEFVMAEGTVRRWWNDQRIWMVRGLTSYLFGTAQYIANHLGISGHGFNVTSKVIEQEQNGIYERGLFDLGAYSPFFVSLGMVAIINLASLFIGVARAAKTEGAYREMFIHLLISAFGVANCLPIYEAMFLRNDRGRMSGLVTAISCFLAGLLIILGYFMFMIV